MRLVAQIFTSWNPVTIWLRGVDELRNVIAYRISNLRDTVG